MVASEKYLLLYIVQILTQHSVNGGNMEGFIVGGEYTTIDKYPHAAFLQNCCGLKSWICGSSVLNQRIALTAAHCIQNCSFEQYGHMMMLFLGHEDLRNATTLRRVLFVKIHSGYEEITALHDIALVGVQSNIPLHDTIKRVIIPQTYSANEYREGYVAGWGNTGTEAKSLVLKKAYQKLRPGRICNIYKAMNEGAFCASGIYIFNTSNPDRGDSGSGLITIRNSYQIGLVSYRRELTPPLIIYTNTTYYYDWITQNARDLFCQLMIG